MASKERLIDANRAKDFAEMCFGDVFMLTAVQTLLDKCPTADAIPVVRCKDCKHWHEETGWCKQHSHFVDSEGEPCHPWESREWKRFDENDFCSYGESKTENL